MVRYRYERVANEDGDSTRLERALETIGALCTEKVIVPTGAECRKVRHSVIV